MQVFDTVLIANRGEIARRVIRTAKSSGFCTVAVYSDADKDSLHVQEADKAVHIGAPEVGSSYLNSAVILDAAARSGANAIHPGYGFLSENAEFASTCKQKGITFIGPDSDAIELMGNKRQAKIAMLKAGVPCLNGYNDSDQSDHALIAAAASIGFPIMIKAAAGGGGRGMRMADSAEQLPALISAARSEANHAFGSDELILEQALIEPRHIEIQIFADHHGNVVYLGERDCSIQRRHQKVVEEAPSPFVDDSLRQEMGEAAVRVAKSCHYVGAGTVEFLVDKNQRFYFLEMNTRLQVEHPVTELITGIDLVAWQLSIAAGEPLPLAQAQINLTGHAIEVRLYAEDPHQHFLPQTGTVALWQYEHNDGVRVDHMLREGIDISAHYDPMLAKMIAWGDNREQARRRLNRLLNNSALLGVNNNRYFLQRLISHPVFIGGDANTAFIAEHFSDDPSMSEMIPAFTNWALATVLFQNRQAQQFDAASRQWSSILKRTSYYNIRHAETIESVSLDTKTLTNGVSYEVSMGERSMTLTLLSVHNNSCTVDIDGVCLSVCFAFENDTLYLASEQGDLRFDNCTEQAAASHHDIGSGDICAIMDGVIVGVQVNIGDNVKCGDTLVVMEAMKMEHPLESDVDGVIESVSISEGEQVKSRQLLVKVAAHSE